MERKIVVGYDGSYGSRDALAFGRPLAAAAGRALTLVCVCPSRPPAWSEHSEEYERRLCQAHAALQDAPLAPEVERHALFGDSVARGLHLHAEGQDAAAIVVGCPARGSAGRIEVGTVAQRLLHGSPCAVALAPRGYAAHAADGFRRIVVGYTDSDEARAALRAAAGLGHACGSTVRIVSVVGDAPSRRAGLAGHADAVRDAAQADLAQALRGLASTVAAEGLVLDGDPVKRLLEQADRWADLIVVGSRGYGPTRQVLLGSISAGLLNSAEVPVIVAPRGAEAELVASRPPASATGAPDVVELR